MKKNGQFLNVRVEYGFGAVCSRTRQQLRKHRTDTAIYSEAEQDDVFIVESILEIKKATKKVLVKWMGFPDATWENEKGIPLFIREYYEKDSTRLGNFFFFLTFIISYIEMTPCPSPQNQNMHKLDLAISKTARRTL